MALSRRCNQREGYHGHQDGLGLNDPDIQQQFFAVGDMAVRTPVDGSTVAAVKRTSGNEVDAMVARSVAVQKAWQALTPPRRDKVMRLFGNELRAHKDALGALVTMEAGTLVGPIMDSRAFHSMQAALSRAVDEGGTVTGGERVLEAEFPGAYYVRPVIAKMPGQTGLVKEETFAPILYAMRCSEFANAMTMHSDVPQGLNSCIFTTDVFEAKAFVSDEGSDCNIANVHIGPSGAEIGDNSGGEKETGDVRKSGSDAWRAHMRRQTNTINYSSELPLAQGIDFNIG